MDKSPRKYNSEFVKVIFRELTCDPETGVFAWTKVKRGRRRRGVGYSNPKTGYLNIWVDGALHQGHILAWMLFYGSPPTRQIDHVNGNRLDNRKENLRTATNQQNAFNQVKRKSASNFKGVIWQESIRKWRARINFNRKTIWLGSFATEYDAAIAYDAAAKRLFGCYARLNISDKAA